MRYLILLLLVYSFQVSAKPINDQVDYQQIQVNFDLDGHKISGQSQFSSLSDQKNYTFYLNSGLTIKEAINAKFSEIVSQSTGKVKVYQLYGIKKWPVEIQYEGIIFDDYQNDGESDGLIDQSGIMLFTGTFWAPYFEDRMFNFDLEVTVPNNNWQVVSQGNLISHTRDEHTSFFHWQENSPQNDLYLIASEYEKYSSMENGIEASLYLKGEDTALAEQYLGLTHEYIDLFTQEVGPYPYAKFATIEGLWENMGFGMPSFTILGPTVLRFPWILYSSFPHEILHNWWGNSVYVDYENGNWCEGLTTYMADQYLKEQQGQGDSYRRTALQNYKDYVKGSNEFTLRQFKGRHNSSSQAIGYGKVMMFFHMLKIQLGADTFKAAIKDFYQSRLFKVSSYEDIQTSFERVANIDLENIFRQWIDRLGAPNLQIKSVTKNKDIHLSLVQNNLGKLPYELYIPVQLKDKEGKIITTHVLKMSQLEQQWNLGHAENVKSVNVDPKFDVFRRLLDGETPPALSGIYSESKKIIFILPVKDQDKYRLWIKTIAHKYSAEIQIVVENKITSLPVDGSVWVLGENIWLKELQTTLGDYQVTVDGNTVKLASGKIYQRDQHGVVLSVAHPQKEKYFMGWVSSPSTGNFVRLAQKMLHYGKYGVLVFAGEKNLVKQPWPAIYSPLEFKF
ncbi:MAG: hypothetical protein HON90_08075 [Halobacteriovoraceae bacterium]|nr:hypothetical protein [Halobacteriovoraceae bacterium]